MNFSGLCCVCVVDVLYEYFCDVGGVVEVVVDLEWWMCVKEIWICVVVCDIDVFYFVCGFQ